MTALRQPNFNGNVCGDPYDKSDAKVSHNALLCHQNMVLHAVRPSPFAHFTTQTII